MSTMDDLDRSAITAFLKSAATVLLSCDLWRGSWRVEVDGCVYKFKIEAYPKHGTPRWKARETERIEAMAEWEAENGSAGTVRVAHVHRKAARVARGPSDPTQRQRERRKSPAGE